MQDILTERHGTVLLVRLNRPRRRNAITLALLERLDEALSACERDPDVRALVITGDEQAFCAGQDLKEPEPPGFVEAINATFNRLERLPVPTVAAVDGWCLAGGLELALACDLRVAGDKAKIGDWHAKINSIGGAGATVRLVRLLGVSRAKELVFSGAALGADEARGIGLVSRVYPSADLVGSAVAFARTLCIGDPVTVRHAKMSMNAAVDLPLAEALAFSLQCQQHVRNAFGSSFTERFAAREGQGDTA